ncbi:hypothetical protein [Lactococcus lactis]|nr:hypothetical protein [Lactococcus lactis]
MIKFLTNLSDFSGLEAHQPFVTSLVEIPLLEQKWITSDNFSN